MSATARVRQVNRVEDSQTQIHISVLTQVARDIRRLLQEGGDFTPAQVDALVEALKNELRRNGGAIDSRALSQALHARQFSKAEAQALAEILGQ